MHLRLIFKKKTLCNPLILVSQRPPLSQHRTTQIHNRCLTKIEIEVLKCKSAFNWKIETQDSADHQGENQSLLFIHSLSLCTEFSARFCLHADSDICSTWQLGYMLCGLLICVEQGGAMGEAISWSEEWWVAFNRDVPPLLLPAVAMDGRQVWARVGGLASLQHVLGP